MRYGYSLVERRALEASEIGYDDTRNKQVICPVCKEPAIKVVRGSGEAAIHFLKHHKGAKDPAERAKQTRCDLRTSWMDRGQVTALAQSNDFRGQTLEAFLQGFEERIVAATQAMLLSLDKDWRGDARANLRRFVDSGHFEEFSFYWDEEPRKPCTPDEAKDHISDLATRAGFDAAGPESAADIADFINEAEAHLATPGARKNMDTLKAGSSLVANGVGLMLARLVDRTTSEELQGAATLAVALDAVQAAAFLRTDWRDEGQRRYQTDRATTTYAEKKYGRREARSMASDEKTSLALDHMATVARGMSRKLLALTPFAHMLGAQGTPPATPATVRKAATNAATPRADEAKAAKADAKPRPSLAFSDAVGHTVRATLADGTATEIEISAEELRELLARRARPAADHEG